jgi:hypothetical protein
MRPIPFLPVESAVVWNRAVLLYPESFRRISLHVRKYLAAKTPSRQTQIGLRTAVFSALLLTPLTCALAQITFSSPGWELCTGFGSPDGLNLY